MTSTLKPGEQEPKKDFSAFALIILVILVATAGTIAASFYLIESLDDNSKKLRKYDVKQDDATHRAALDLWQMRDSRNLTADDHPECDRLEKEAERLRLRGKFKSATEFYLKALTLLDFENKGVQKDLNKEWVSQQHLRLSHQS